MDKMAETISAKPWIPKITPTTVLPKCKC